MKIQVFTFTLHLLGPGVTTGTYLFPRVHSLVFTLVFTLVYTQTPDTRVNTCVTVPWARGPELGITTIARNLIFS